MSTSREWRSFVVEAVCLSLLLQTSGIAEAVPLSPKQELLTQEEWEASRTAEADASEGEPGWISQLVDQGRSSIDESVEAVTSSLRSRWRDGLSSFTEETPQVAQLGGVMPLPPRLMAAFFSAGQHSVSGPPSPPGLEDSQREAVLPPALAMLAAKAATEEIPLLPGYNLISIPEEPADTDPVAVFAAIGGQFQKVSAYDACDLSDPWKLYDPADPAASDLTAVDHRIGLWVDATTATALPSDGTLPASTTMDLCVGWNLVGFPAGQARHPLAALSSIAGKWERVFGYDAFDSQDPWEIFDPAVPDWANDLRLMQPGRGYWVLVTEPTILEIRNQGPPPTVAISAPADLAVVTQPTEIVGTVASDRLESWTLTYRAIGDGDPVTLVTSNAPVAEAAFGTFDPTLLLNGLYELELTATDFQGQQVSESIAVAVEGQMKIGHFTLSFVDLAIPVSGLDVEIIRTYDSRDKQQRDFGVGWSLDIRQGSYRNNRPPGDGWQFQTGFLPCDTILESKSHLTVVRLSDQEVYRFALKLANGVPSTSGGCFADAHFDFVDGPLPDTTLEILGQTQVFYANGSDRVINVDTFELYEPEDVRLTTRDGRIFEFDLTAGVTRLEDLNGNQLTITPSGITHSSGRGVVFDRDAAGRIERITDPLGRVITYAYNAAGDLVVFNDRAGTVTRFTYDDGHRLLDIEDPRGVKPLRNEYDTKGRIVRHIDAFGRVIELDHDRKNRREIVTNRLGASRVLEYNARGNVVRETDELGKVTLRTFDGRDNLLSETDPLGRMTIYTYTSGNDLETMTNPLGFVIRYTYNYRGKLLTVTDPLEGVTTSVYDARGNLTGTTDALGAVTTFAYDDAGNLLTRTDALGNLTRFEYNAVGHRVKEIDALGHELDSTYDEVGNLLTKTSSRTFADGTIESLVTTFVYDGLDRLTTTTFADGSRSSTTYDLLSNITSRTDALGRVTTLTYDLMGNLTNTSYPDGSTEALAYDNEDNVVAQLDRLARTTTFVYDPTGRLLKTVQPDGASTTSAYDAAGQLVTTTNARGGATSVVYDAAGRRITVIDPLGNGPTFAYDANGNQTAITDAKGQTTHFTYDALNRLLTTSYADGTTTRVAYDELGRRAAEIDQTGFTTEFTYDPFNRLTNVEDALGKITSYTYDQGGNRVARTDANGNTTRFEYDRLNRQTVRILPDGARESMIYNADGTLASHTDFNGTTVTFQYDANQQLSRRTYPDGSEVTFTYTPTGQRAAVADTRGTTTYTYDSRDRLTEKANSAGHKLSYNYDSEGNRTSLTATVGAEIYTTTYAYDLLNRLTMVTDSQGGVTTMSYDVNGNQSSLVFPHGATTSYTYDVMNRPAELRSETAIGDVIQSYQYIHGPAGNRTRVDEHPGLAKRYQYDDLYRLTQERVTGPAEDLVYQRGFTYDSVGNRLTQSIEEGSGPRTISSIYDTRDRLLNAGATTYSWDSNGNLASKIGSNETSYGWDFENRLTSVILDTGTLVETSYDADGNRVRTAVTPINESPRVVNYLVDTTGFLSHVVADIVNGSVQTLYTRAEGRLVSHFRPSSGSKRYYHSDGLGSVRVLSGENGAATDRYAFSSFGELLAHEGVDSQSYQFAGESYDPDVRLYYNRARWLETEAGRFVAIDPFQGWAEFPISMHGYLYAELSPATNTDPSGRFLAPGGANETLIVARVQSTLRGVNIPLAFERFRRIKVATASLAVISLLTAAAVGTVDPTGRMRRRSGGRIQIQGGDLVKRWDHVTPKKLQWSWAHFSPTKFHGIAALLSLWNMLDKNERKRRATAYEQAGRYILKGPHGPPGQNFSRQSEAGKWRGKLISRIDVEIKRGFAFH